MRLSLCVIGTLLGLLVGLLGPSVVAAQHYSNCLEQTDTGTSATVVVPDTVDLALPDGVEIRDGDELALYTTDSTCAGHVVWRADGGAETMVAVGGSSTPRTQDPTGYAADEPLKLEVWDASKGQEYAVGTALAYVPCGSDAPLCRDDGRYENDTIFTLEQIGESDQLPVELTRFTAVRTQGRARLEWVTASETNNAGFEVTHRPASSSQWRVLEFVEAKPSREGATRYRYTTSRLDPGRHLFRLRQIDIDGSTSLSRVVEIQRSLQKAVSLSGVRPSPVRQRGTLVLRVGRRQHVTATLFDLLGRPVRSVVDATLAAGRRHELTVRARGLPSGQYVLRVRGADFSVTRRVTVIR